METDPITPASSDSSPSMEIKSTEPIESGSPAAVPETSLPETADPAAAESTASVARQTLGLALSGRLTEQAVKRVHKALAVQHHPDKGGDPDVMTRLNNARDVLLQPEMSDTLAS